MKNQVLSIDQMQKLKLLGIDTIKASMHWQLIPTANNILGKDSSEELELFVSQKYKMDHCNPAFTLQDMLSIMPDSIMMNRNRYYLYLDKKCTGYINIEECYCHSESDEDILLNTYNMLIWLAENKYI